MFKNMSEVNHTHTVVTLTARDFSVMRLIGTDGLASFKTLHAKFWPLAKARYCRDRLRKLEKAGWLESHYVVDTHKESSILVFTLTPSGAKAHFNQVERQAMMIGLPAYAEIHQQLMAQQARFILEERLKRKEGEKGGEEEGGGLHLIEWNNERQLRSEARLRLRPGSRSWGRLSGVADARARIINPKTGEVFEQLIEVDGHYFGKMLRQKIARIAADGKKTLWVTTSDRRVKILKEVSQAAAENIELLIVD